MQAAGPRGPAASLFPTTDVSRTARAAVVLTAAGALLAAVGCVLPWESLGVDVSSTATIVGAPHGTGAAACAGAALALLATAHLAWRPSPSAAREACLALAGTLLVLGAALFTWRGGYRPGSGQRYDVTLGVGLPLAGAGGLAVLAGRVLTAVSRRAG